MRFASGRGVLVGVGTALGISILVVACSTPDAARVALTMRAPQGLLDEATRVTLSVFDAEGAMCGADGHVDVPDDAQEFDLRNGDCAADAIWCGEITLDRDGSTKMFSVSAANAGGTLAEGCAPAKIDQDPVDVDIKVVRVNPPACCSDGVLQAGEQCEGTPAPTDCAGGPPGECAAIIPDEVCECNCTSKEIPVDRVDVNAVPAQQTQLDMAMSFASGTGLIPDALRLIYVDSTAAGGADIRVRFLQSDFRTSPSPLNGPLGLPVSCAGAGGSIIRQQSEPAIGTTGDDTVIAFVSNAANAAVFDVYAQHQDESGCTPTSQLNGGLLVSSGGGASKPAVAGGPAGTAMIVWTQNGGIRARSWQAPVGNNSPVLGAEFSVAVAGSNPKITGNGNGWVVAYQGSGAGDGDGVFVKSIDTDFTVGSETRVNASTAGAQTEPDVSMFDDGRFAVVWQSGDDIFLQRYSASGDPVAGDQDNPLNTTTDGEQTSPSIAASVGFGDFYAAAWQTTDTGEIWARLAGGQQSFLFNSVTGQNDDFLASVPTIGGARRTPTVAIGGDGSIAIGWHDDSAEHAGVYVRKFPLPAQ